MTRTTLRRVALERALRQKGAALRVADHKLTTSHTREERLSVQLAEAQAGIRFLLSQMEEDTAEHHRIMNDLRAEHNRSLDIALGHIARNKVAA